MLAKSRNINELVYEIITECPLDVWQDWDFGIDGSTASSSLDVVRMDHIISKKIAWFWPDRIPFGKLTLLMGDPGTGKSILTIDIAARLSKGTGWPDGTGCQVGDVLICSAEDDPADTIRPRLDAAGADNKRISFVNGVKTPYGNKVFELQPENLKSLSKALEEAEGSIKLIIIDPISAYLSGTDQHINAEVRKILTPLATLAAKHGVAVIAVTHMNKSAGGNAMYRAMGSLGFVAAARAAFLVVKQRDNSFRRLFLPVKNNLGPDEGGLAFRIIQNDIGVPYVSWDEGEIIVTADEALQPLEPFNPTRSTAQQQARAWLLDQMAGGSEAAQAIEARAVEANISPSTLTRARSALGIESRKVGSSWVWSMPQEKPAPEKFDDALDS